MVKDREIRLVRATQEVGHVLMKLERQHAAVHGISTAQRRVLLFLREAHELGVDMADLARAMGVAGSTMTRNLQGLEARGFVGRQADERDRRKVLVHLSPEGMVRAAALHASWQEAFSRAFRDVHPSDRLERTVALERVVADLIAHERATSVDV